jgi:hypothetical protein
MDKKILRILKAKELRMLASRKSYATNNKSHIEKSIKDAIKELKRRKLKV